MKDFYVTTFCNFAHDLKTGRPISHECYIIPPKLLKLEMEADTCEEWDHCHDEWAKWGRGRRIMVVGRKDREEVDERKAKRVGDAQREVISYLKEKGI
jgi:hypothetical protein